MKKGVKPRALRRGLKVTRRGGEIMIFDLRGHYSHHLNRLAARVWELSDGQRTVAQVVEGLAQRPKGSLQVQCLIALKQLTRAGLVTGAPLEKLDRMIREADGDNQAAGKLEKTPFVRTVDCDVKRRAAARRRSRSAPASRRVRKARSA